MVLKRTGTAAKKKTTSSKTTKSTGRSTTKKKSAEPEFGWQNISLWEADRGNAVFSGKINFTPEFIEDLLDRIDDGDLDLNKEGYFTVNVSIRENTNENPNAPVYLGNIYVPEPQEEEAPRRRARR